MEKRHPVLERLARGQCVVTDGSPVEPLLARGFVSRAPLYTSTAPRETPGLLLDAHTASVEAGVDVLIALTAQTTVRALARGGLGMRASAITHQAVDLALDAARSAARPIAVAAAIGPLEAGAMSPRAFADEHTEQARRLASSGCQAILVESMPTSGETLAATAAARGVMTEVWVVIPREANPVTMAEALLAIGAQALIFEDESASAAIARAATVQKREWGVPLGVRASNVIDAVAARAVGVTLFAAGVHAPIDAVRALADHVRRAFGATDTHPM